MRPYRGLTKEDKWVYGWYQCTDPSTPDKVKHYIIDCCGVTSTALVLAHTLSDLPGYHEVIPETVGQSIIVEGKEFYEGDVTKDDTGDIGVVQFGKLPLDKSGDCVCSYPAFYIKCFGQLGQAPTYECQVIGKWMEVIGTIHTTHPELMEQGK